MGAYRCETHGITYFARLCRHVSDAFDAARDEDFVFVMDSEHEPHVVCTSCAAGLTLDDCGQTAADVEVTKLIECGECFDAWMRARSRGSYLAQCWQARLRLTGLRIARLGAAATIDVEAVLQELIWLAARGIPVSITSLSSSTFAMGDGKENVVDIASPAALQIVEALVEMARSKPSIEKNRWAHLVSIQKRADGRPSVSVVMPSGQTIRD